MKAARAILLLGGVGFGLWGLWLMREFGSDRLVSAATWLVAGVIIHDFVLSPVIVLLGVVAARRLPGHARAAVAGSFLVWATLTIAFLPVLSGKGGKPDNASLLDRPYLLSWLVLTAVLVGFGIAAGLRRRRIFDR